MANPSRIPESFLEHRQIFSESWVDRWTVPNQFVSPLSTLFGHEVTMTCLDWDIDSIVYFAKDQAFRRNVVGRLGWLEKFKLGLIHHDSLLLLSRYDD